MFGFSFGAEGVRAPFDIILAALRVVSERAPGDGNATSVGVGADGSSSADGAPVRRAASMLRGDGSGIPVVSIDVPSGWDVDAGDVLPRSRGGGLRPSMMVSLTAPKPCAAAFDGPHHWLGGRFLPPSLAAKYGLAFAEDGELEGSSDDAAARRRLPAYPGSSQAVRLW